MSGGRVALLAVGSAIIAGSCQAVAESPIELLEPLTSSVEPRAACAAAQAPILFHSAREPAGTLSQLYVMEADGRGLRRLAGDNLTQYHGAVWSPEGRRIAYRRLAAPQDRVPRVPSELGLLEPGVGAVPVISGESPFVEIATIDSPPDGPTWAPDGTELAFAEQEPSGAWAVWRVEATGAGRQRLLPDDERQHWGPAWSPRSPSALALVLDLGDRRAIGRVDPDAPGEPELLADESPAAWLAPAALRWSPDGRRLAFSALDPAPADAGGGDREIYILDVAERTWVRVTDDVYDDVTPAWSPDGDSLLVASDRPAGDGAARRRGYDVWRLPLDASVPPMRLTDGIGLNAGPDWFDPASCR